MSAKHSIYGVVGLVLLALVMTSCGRELSDFTVETGPTVTETQTVQSLGAQAAEVKLKLGVGKLTISGGSNDLMTGIFTYNVPTWKPEVEYLDSRVATIRGYHRSFCLHMRQWRATPEQPGLMMALDRGGQCKGVIFRLDHDAMEEQLKKLLYREMRMRPSNNKARWVTAMTDQGPVPALAFVMNRKGPAYVGRLPLDETVTMLARACGHIGSCAEYLYNTVAHLEEIGIHDRHLWHLQELVARRIAEDHGLEGET